MHPEVVFLYGPPFSGKALFYAYHFSQTHEKINPEELFEADPSLSLRAVILKVVNALNKGKSVVVDDENSSKKTRKSYLTILRNKVPQCGFRVINFQASASSGQFICQWAREWELARKFELSEFSTSLKQFGKDVVQWFEKRTEPPTEEEGFSKIDAFDVRLVCDTPYKFIVPALILQWEGLFQDQQGETNVQEAVVDVVKRWSHSNTHGRLIVLQLGEKQTCKVTSEESCECVDKIKQVISELVTQAAIPVFFVHVCSFLWQFSRPPSPGLFAWLQRLHNIDLSNRATFYVHSSDSHSKAATAAGVKCIKASKLFPNPQMINAVHCGVAVQVPEYVSKAKLAWFGSHSSRPEACVPLIREAVASHDMQSQCVTVSKDSYVHGVCFKDFASLDRFNSRYKLVATPTKPASGDIFNYQGRASEVNIQQERNDSVPSVASGASITPLDKSPACSKMDEKKIPDAICLSVLVKHLTREAIESHAFSSGHFRRGEGCIKLIRSVSITMEEDGMLFTAKCVGSQGQLYDVSVVLSQKGLVRAGCSCADPASKLGRCKHGVGLLLWCKNEKNEAMCGVSADINEEEVPSQLGKNKSLPKWISSLAQSTSHDDDRGKRTKAEDSSTKLRQKRFKTKKGAESTIYCLSPEELLQTAQEILEENRCSWSGEDVDKPQKADYRRQSKDRSQLEHRAKQSLHIMKEPHKVGCNRENLDSPVNTDVLNKEMIVKESCRDTLSNRPDKGSLSRIIPETVATLECHSKETSPSVHEPLSQMEEERQELTNNEKHGTAVRTSILDEFI
ncbi:uncharacterized protein LOC144638827 isoform X2 [Oculina patagonica]